MSQENAVTVKEFRFPSEPSSEFLLGMDFHKLMDMVFAEREISMPIMEGNKDNAILLMVKFGYKYFIDNDFHKGYIFIRATVSK